MNKKLKFVFIIILISLAFIGARQLGTFGNTLSSGNITFFGDENSTLYLNLSRYSNVSYAYFNFSGYAIDEGTYINSWDTLASGNDNPHGITTNGTYIWSASYAYDKVYKYDMDGNYISQWDLHANNGAPRGMGNNGSDIWVADSGNDEVYHYKLNGTYIDSFDTNAAGNAYPLGLTTDGNYIWVTENVGDAVYKYQMDGTYVESWATVGFPSAIATNGDFIWVGDAILNKVFKYDMNGNYLSSFDLNATANPDIYGLEQYGDYFWTVDGTNDDACKYIMKKDYPTEAYLDVGTTDVIVEGTYVSNFWATTGENTNPDGITQNGTYFWTTNVGNNRIYKYDMDGTYTGEYWEAQEGTLSAITNNGTYFWITDYDNAEVDKYYMNGTHINSWALATPHINPEGITTNNTYIWVTDLPNDKVYVYDMVGNYVSNWSITDSNALNNEADAIMQHGINLWISDWFDDRVYVYDMDGGYTGEYWSITDRGAGLTTNGTYIWNSYNTAGTTDGVYQYYMNGNPINHWDTAGDGLKSPKGIETNGTYIWITNGTTSLDIFYFNMSGDLEGSWSPTAANGLPQGITTNNSYIWLTDTNDDEVYFYQMDGTYVDSFDTAGFGSSFPFGITQNGTYIWITDWVDKVVYKLDMDGNYISQWDLHSENTAPYGITNDGTYLFINNDGIGENNRIYKYDMYGNYISRWAAPATATRGIASYGNYFWLVDYSTDEVYKQHAETLNAEWYYEGKFASLIPEGTYTGEHWDTATNTDPISITQNGTYFWSVNRSGDSVSQYQMDGTYVGSWTVSGEMTLPWGITNNGTSIWVVESSAAKEVFEYQMDGTYTGRHWDTSAQCSTCYGITTNNKYFWIVSVSTDEIFKYNMDGTYVGAINTSADGDLNCGSITNDGTYLWILRYEGDEKVIQYDMDGTYISSWDISDANALNGEPFGITNDGTYFWITDSTDDEVYKYYMAGNYLTVMNKTSNISASINSALNNGACDCTGCLLNGDNCSIPFLFHSDTIGKLEYLDIDVSYMVKLTRNPTTKIETNTKVDKTRYVEREVSDSITTSSSVSRVRKVIRNIIQFFQTLFRISTTGTFLPFNWITSTETTTQGQAIEKIRVPWEFNDTWVVSATSPQNWTNVTKTYTLPVDCGNVQIDIDGVNMSGSMYVNSTDCVYSVINNRTLEPTNVSWINITYTTGATTSAEGSWIASNKRLYQNTSWINTLTMSNPTIHDYVDIGVNITADTVAISAAINVTNSTNDKLSHAFDSTNGNVDWNLSKLDSGDNDVSTIKYKTNEINITKVDYNKTILGKDYDIYNVTVDVNSSRSVLTVYSYFNFSDDGVISNKLYKCDNGLNICTEDISSRIDVAWSDNDGDGSYDFVEWYITNLTQNQSYQLYNDKGLPIEVTISTIILNPPIKPFDTISWQTTISMYNPNAFATEKVYKYEFPLGSRDAELDGIGKNLQYDPYGTLAPYITIVDKEDTSYLSSVYLSPGETKTFLITYRTDSVTIYASTYFPSYFEIGENALIVNTLRVKNQAENNVTDVEYRIPIDYAEDLIVCEGEYLNGCPDEDDSRYDNVTLDTKDNVKGDYKLELDEIEAGESKMITLSYYVPTAVVDNIEKGRRSIQGVLIDFKKVTITSTSPYTMDDLRYKETEIKIENIVDVFKCSSTGICDIPLIYTGMNIKLGAVGIGERIEFFIWSIPEGEDLEEENWLDKIWGWFIDTIWNGGKKYEVSGFLKYIIGWLSSEEDGKLYIYSSRIIFLLSIVGLIIGLFVWLRIRKKRKARRLREL